MCSLSRKYINREILNSVSFIHKSFRCGGSMPIHKLQKGYLCVLLIILSPTALTLAIRNEKFVDWDGDLERLLQNGNLRKSGCNTINTDEENYRHTADDYLKNIIKNDEISNFLSEKKRNLARMPIYHSGHPIHCSCGMEFHVRDLGLMYFPRYVPTGICQANGCPYKCSGKEYLVRVLRKREEDEGINFDKMPENLRANYTSEIIPVTVACECVP